MKKTKVLFLPIHLSSAKTFEEIAMSGRKYGVESHFFLPEKMATPELDKSIKIYRENEIKSFSLLGLKILTKVFLLIHYLDKKSLFLMALKNYLKLKRAEYILKAVLQKVSIDKVILFGDRHFLNGIEPALIKCAIKKKIPIIIPAHGHYSDIPSVLINRRDPSYWVKDFTRENQKITTPYFDQETNQFLSFHSEDLVMAFKWFGLIYKNPWAMGGSFATCIMTDSTGEKKRYEKDGAPKDKIVVTGQLIHDYFFKNFIQKEKLKKDLFDTFSLPSNQKLIILALPQLYEHKLMGQTEHWKEIDFLLKKFSEYKSQTFISLHPKMKMSEYLPKIESYGLRILPGPLKNWISACDIFVGSSGSSTIQWAGLCAIPTIIYDFYQLNYQLELQNPGFIPICDKIELVPTLNRLNDSNHWDEICSRMQPFKANYGQFDGLAEERMMSIIADCII